MIALTALMCLLLGYQVTMPAVNNAKYTFTVYDGQIVRMNTQDGTFDVCDKQFNCVPTKEKNHE